MSNITHPKIQNLMDRIQQENVLDVWFSEVRYGTNQLPIRWDVYADLGKTVGSEPVETKIAAIDLGDDLLEPFRIYCVDELGNEVDVWAVTYDVDEAVVHLSELLLDWAA